MIPLVFCNISENSELKWNDLLVHCCTLSLCHLGSEMIITDIHISIQRSSSGLLTSGDLNVPLTHDHHDMLMTSVISEAPHLHGQSALRCHPRMVARRDDRFNTIFAFFIVIIDVFYILCFSPGRRIGHCGNLKRAISADFVSFLGKMCFFCSFYIKGGSSPVYDIRSVTHIVSNIHLLMILNYTSFPSISVLRLNSFQVNIGFWVIIFIHTIYDENILLAKYHLNNGPLSLFIFKWANILLFSFQRRKPGNLCWCV